MRTPVSLPPPPMQPPTGGDATSNSVFAMMSFMGQQQALQLEAMKFQTYQLLRGSKEDFFLELQRSQYRGDLFHLEINEAKLFPPKQNSLEN